MSAILFLAILAQQPESRTHDEMERFLSHGKLLRLRTLATGITNSQRATLETSGATHDAHVQTIDEFKPHFQGVMGSEVNFKDTYKFNIAAYRLDRFLDLNMIPCTVERAVERKSASVTWWIDNARMTEFERHRDKLTPPDRDHWNKQMWIVRVFDQLIANADRNLGNLVIDADWNLWMIDHTRAFRMRRELSSKDNLEKCERSLLAKLRQLDRKELRAALSPYVNSLEVDGIMARSRAIVAYFDEKIAREGEAAVLYDYLPERKAKHGR